LRDVGRDDRGRPHTLRIEAALLSDPEILGDADALAGLVDEHAWPQLEWDSEPPSTLTLRPAGSDSSVRQAIVAGLRSHRRCPHLIAGADQINHDPRSFDASFLRGVGGWSEAPAFDRPGRPPGIGNPHPSDGGTPGSGGAGDRRGGRMSRLIRRSGVWALRLWAVVAVALVVTIGWEWASLREDNQRLGSDLKASEDSASEERRGFKRELTSFNNERADLRRSIQGLEQRNRELERTMQGRYSKGDLEAKVAAQGSEIEMMKGALKAIDDALQSYKQGRGREAVRGRTGPD
jgi:hypothetical protein